MGSYFILFILTGHSILGNILTNSVSYYQQFASAVVSHTKQLTSVVEKEFKVSNRKLYYGSPHSHVYSCKVSTHYEKSSS